MAYKLFKSKVDKKQYTSKEGMQEMLDVLAIGERITTDQYQEFTALLTKQ
ncbi:hypothetical protein [Solibacillus sp. CAU 1738]